MKTFFLNILVFTTIFISCCDKEEPTTITDELYGEWSLIYSYSGGFGWPETFELNDIIWKFNSDNTISVTLNVTPVSEIPLGITGVYEYALDGNYIRLPDSNTFEFEFISDGARLRLLQDEAAGGPANILFEKL